MRAMMWVLCACLLSGATLLGEEKKKDPPPLPLFLHFDASIEVRRTFVTKVGAATDRIHVVVTVKGNDVKSMQLITYLEKPSAILVQTRGGSQCFCTLPAGDTVTLKDWSLDLVRQGKDSKSYLDGNRWSWRLKEGEPPNLRRIIGRGTLHWRSNGEVTFHEEQSKRLWHRVFFALQN